MTNLTPYQEAALSYNKHIALTANAGSGKTFVFSKRFVKILMHEDINLDQIVAITFTEKAAAELYVKIAKELDEEIRSVQDDSKYRKLLRLRNHLVSANISTIHSFCFNLLKEYSPVIGLDSNMVLLDASAASELKEKAISAFLDLEMNGENSNEVKNLIRILGSKTSLMQQLKYGLNKIKIVKNIWEDIYKHDNPSITTHFNEQYKQLFELVVKPKIKYAVDTITLINNEVFNNDDTNTIAIEVNNLLTQLDDSNELYDCLQILLSIKSQILTSQNKLRNRGYLKKAVEQFNLQEIEIADFFESVVSFNYTEDEFKLSSELASFGKSYLSSVMNIENSYSQYKRTNGLLDYDDLIVIAEELLLNAEVRAALSEKYKFIMIDEYQDTDDTQFNIFSPILDQLQIGNLFVVGDEKQSIYMFRDADLKVFDKTKRLIKETSGKDGILELPHSFRLSPKIAFFCNTVFTRLMANPELTFNEVPYNNLVTTRDDIDTGEVELLLSDGKNDVTEEMLVCNKLIELVETKKIAFSEIAILVRKRKSFATLEQALSRQNIPYAIIGGRGFYEQQEIYDIHNYLQFLIDTSNNAALVGILRSPFFQISDSDLLAISLKNESTFYEKLIACKNENAKFDLVVEMLSLHLLAQNYLDIASLIRKIIIDTKYLAVHAGLKDSDQKVANINKLINRAKHFHNNQLISLYDFVQKLQELINLSEDEGQAQLTNDGNVVNLMTIHQSKGLEYKAVFLFNGHLKSNSDIIKSRQITIDKEYGILTKLPINGNYFSNYESAPIVKIGNYKAVKQSIAEVKRLMYVGVTRAADYLYLSGDISKTVDQTSFLGLLKNSLDFDDFPDQINISGKIDYMYEDEERYKTKELNLDYNINIESNLSYVNKTNGLPERRGTALNELEINTGTIAAVPKNEIVSATKMNMFLQCPLKYNLSYNLGYIDLHNSFGQNTKVLFDKHDDDTTLPADVRGSLIHRILEKGIISKPELEEFLLSQIKRLEGDQHSTLMTDEIVNELINFYSSQIFKEINLQSDFKNEFEVYARFNDFYIYGILDKCYNTPDGVVIVDYKTDKVSEETYLNKFEYYRNQLLFYCLLINTYHSAQSDIEVKLVFISKPELTVSQKIIFAEIEKFRDSVITIVDKIRNDDFSKNLEHCNVCQYSINNNCVIK